MTIIFDGADFSTGQMVLTTSPEIAMLSWTGHITFLTAFALLVVIPKLFFESSQGFQTQDGRRWAVLKQGRQHKAIVDHRFDWRDRYGLRCSIPHTAGWISNSSVIEWLRQPRSAH